MSAFHSVNADNSGTFFRALGWLTSAVEQDHPGYLATQAERARSIGDHDLARMFEEWASGVVR